MTDLPPKNFRDGLITAYKNARNYLRYLLTDLAPEQAEKEPVPESRTIIHYLIHIANSELYWLSASGRRVAVYAKQVPLNIAIDLLDEVQQRMIRELKNCSEDELVYQPPSEKSKPSLGWVVAHITLHTLYHSAEIIYTRYAVEGSDLPNDEVEELWGQMMNAVTQLIFCVKQ